MSLNSKLTICEDQSIILDFLVDNQELPQDFSQNMVKNVLKDGAFYLVIYKAYEKGDRFTLYRIDDFAYQFDDLLYLWRFFDEKSLEKQHAQVMKKARNIVHDIISMLETLKSLFEPPQNI
ncbi:hypothetical protein [Flectobacillus longus]|uniref:hypothetical protein n=1 Tax=Flectobacillus longus TaxID=2984207 RepID=UPI0024B7E0ED|nr:hypothetical protein [Flectobacillus longus]MDI9880710.1 hypothetical protein [Flectobacillus longus]